MSARKDDAILKLAGQMHSMAKEAAKAALDMLKKKLSCTLERECVRTL